MTTNSDTPLHIGKLKSKGFHSLRQKLEALAASGDVSAEVELANLYLKCHDEFRDPQQANHWLSSAAQKGNDQAQRILARLLYADEDFGINLPQAFAWTKKLAQGGDADFQLILGKMYHYGEGVECDDVEAFKWLEKSMANGNADAAMFLGLYSGHPGPLYNPQKMLSYITHAAEQGHAYAMSFLARGYLTTFYGQIPQDTEKATRWALSAAQNGIAGGYLTLYSIKYQHYLKGSDEADPKQQAMELMKLLEEAVKLKDDIDYQEVCLRLAEAYEEGIITTINIKKSVKYYSIAATHYPHARYKYAQALEYGYGVQEDNAKAFINYKLAYDAGFYEAAHRLGLYYEAGIYVRQDFNTAGNYYHEAIANNYLEACFDLSQLYWRGLGVPRDLIMAHKLMQVCMDRAQTPEERIEIDSILEMIYEEMTLKEYEAFIGGKRRKHIPDFNPSEHSQTLH